MREINSRETIETKELDLDNAIDNLVIDVQDSLNEDLNTMTTCWQGCKCCGWNWTVSPKLNFLNKNLRI